MTSFPSLPDSRRGLFGADEEASNGEECQCVTRARKSCSQRILHTHVFERDEPLVDGFPGGPLAAGEDVAHARLVRLVLAHAAREAVAGDACNGDDEKGTLGAIQNDVSREGEFRR